jgi:glycolate oxidase iron-sulfur subunit
MFLLATELAERPGSVFENIFSKCLLCTACEQVCPRHLPITDVISRARSRFSTFYGRGGVRKFAARAVLARPGLLQTLVQAGISVKRLHGLPAHSGLRLRLGLLEERCEAVEKMQSTVAGDQETRVTYFSGCLARHLQPSIARATHHLLGHLDLQADEPAAQRCCGLAAWSAGKREQARELARKNIEVFSRSSGPIVTSCSSCSSHLQAYPQLFSPEDPWHARAIEFAQRVQEFTSFFRTKPACAPAQQRKKVFYHDPCHLRYRNSGQSSPRDLLSSMNLQVLDPAGGPVCCGQGGLFHLAYPESSAAIFTRAAQTALADDPDCITTTCSGCLMQYQLGMAEQGENIRVVHMAVLLAELV